MVLENSMAFCVTKPDFLEKKKFATKIEQMDQKCAKNRVF